MATGTGAVFNRARVQIGDTVAVIGAGGVGLNVIQAARLVGASAIIAIDRVAAKEALARDFGATDFVLAEGDDFDPVAAVKSLCPAGSITPSRWWAAPRCWRRPYPDPARRQRVRRRSARSGGEGHLPVLDLHQNKSLLGIRAGGARPRKDFPMLADLYLRGSLKLDEMISRTAGLDGLQAPSTPSRPAPRPAPSAPQRLSRPTPRYSPR